MNKSRLPSRTVGLVVLIVGVLVALGSGFAETLGVGGGTFGWKQMVGVAGGAVVALAGLYVVVESPAEPPRE